MASHLPYIVDLHLSLGVPSGNLFASVSPSHTVQCWRPLHTHTGSGNLQNTSQHTKKQIHGWMKLDKKTD